MDVILHPVGNDTYAAEGLTDGVLTLVVTAEALSNRRERYELPDDAAALERIVREHAERITGAPVPTLTVTVDAGRWTPPVPAPDPEVVARILQRKADVAVALNNPTVLVVGGGPARDAWARVLGAQPPSELGIPETQPLTADDIVLVGA